MATPIKIFGKHDFLLTEPTLGNLPATVRKAFRARLQRWRTVRALEAASDWAAVEHALDQYVERTERAIVGAGLGWYEARAGKGKTEKSRRIWIRCRKGREPDAGTIVSSFLVPASVLAVAPQAGRSAHQAFLPAFIAHKRLLEVCERDRYQKFERVPVCQACWPPHLKASFAGYLGWQLSATRRSVVDSGLAEETVVRIKKG